MRKMITALVAAGLLFTAACGGDDDDSADAGGGGGDGGGGGSEFCDQAVALFSDSGIDDEEAIAQLESLEPPDEIADDWQTLVEGSQAAAAGEFDATDPNAAEFEEEYNRLLEATTSVYNYLGEECDLEGFSPVDPSDLDTGATDSTVAGG